jgi:UDP-glucuronate decarboxylase
MIGAINMLGLTKRPHARILQGSTSEVHSEPGVHPRSEGYGRLVNMAGPRACHGEGKRCAKTLFYSYGRQHGPSVRVARILNTYGPNMHSQDGSAVSSFIAQGLKIEPITIYGSASQRRSFCYVDDMIHGLTRLINAECDTSGAVNVGNPAGISICERAHFVISLVGSRSKIELRPLPRDDPRQRCPGITRVKQLRHWSPKVHLKECLCKTMVGRRVPAKQVSWCGWRI